ncbi:MAG: hypothetical protein ABIP30_07720 [Ferruginibacter sp.]
MKFKQAITLSSIGVFAYMLADTFHEVLGHGGTCLLLGDKINLLTSVYFKSSSGSFITDIGGPISNLLFGLLLYLFVLMRKDLSALLAFLLFTLMSYNLFWFSGTILQSSFSKTGDWTYLIQQFNIGTFAKPLLIITGIVAYVFSIKLVTVILNKIRIHFPEFPLRQSILCSWFAAASAAVIAGLFFSNDRIHAAFEGLMEMIASLPIIFISIKEKIKFTNYKMRTYFIFNLSVFLLFIFFCFTLGRGIGKV